MKRLYLALVLSAFLPACASTRSTEAQTEPKKWAFWEEGGHYVKAEELPADLVAPPPTPGSAVDKADFAELDAWQKKRTPALCEKVIAQRKVEPEYFFEKLPFEPKASAEAFLLRIRADVGQAVSLFKAKYERPRPFRRDEARFKPCYPESHGTSYPSGHAAISQAYALALGDLDPPHRALYLKEAAQAGLNRVIGAVHHPSDIKAGAALGSAVYERIKQTPQFKKDFASLQGQALKK
jgi:acid phosphatase (class A)